jgi:hypothetical protein
MYIKDVLKNNILLNQNMIENYNQELLEFKLLNKIIQIF